MVAGRHRSPESTTRVRLLRHRASHGVRDVELVDLPVFGRPARLAWRKQRWRCTTCRRCWCDEDPEIGSARCALTTRQPGGRRCRSAATDAQCLMLQASWVAAGTPLWTPSWSSVNATRHGWIVSSGPRSICRPSYRSVFDTMLPNRALDECRRRVQNETCGHRGPRHDLLRRVRRRRLTIARERFSDDQHDRVLGLLRTGDPDRRWFAWNAKEVVRQICDHTDPELADAWVAAVGRDFADWTMPVEVRRLGRTIAKWADQICAWHRSHVSNGPADVVILWIAFGLANFRHDRFRCLVYAGRPDRTLRPTLQP